METLLHFNMEALNLFTGIIESRFLLIIYFDYYK